MLGTPRSRLSAGSGRLKRRLRAELPALQGDATQIDPLPHFLRNTGGPNPVAASVAIQLPQDSGSTRYQISPCSAPLGIATTQRPMRGAGGGLPVAIARTMDLHGSDGDYSSESRRNFSLSSREHKGKSMWRTTSILEIKACRASISPGSVSRLAPRAGLKPRAG
jgi:hypothetical protein